MGIAVLGPLTIEGEQKVLGRRDRVVLAALSVRPGEVVSADLLTDVLWGEHPPASAAKVIQGCVVRLRKLLGNHAIETSPLGYRLAVPADEIDARRFERAIARAGELLAANEAERSELVLADALTLWRGRPLDDLDGWDVAQIEVSRLEELRRTAEEMYVDAALRAGRHDSILAKAQALVAEAPLRERRWGLLATAQYQAGQQSEALRTIHRLRAVLSRELGLDPSPEVDTLEQAILRQDPALVVATALPEPSPRCPYPGLKPYDVADADGFFGRDHEVAACLRKLAETRVLAVIGPSGCGKSSLIRAGVAAGLRRDGRVVVVMTPGAHPVAALTAAVPRGGNAPTLIVDQCEDLFTLCQNAAERETFVSALAAHRQVAPLIVSMRADRLADVASHPALARIVEEGLYLLTGMADDDLRSAIVEPARLAWLVIEPGLVDLLVNDVAGRPGALPLMSHALVETWQRREGRTLTVAGYQASGGIQGAIAQSAEEVYGRFGAEQQSMLRDLLLRLVTLASDGEPVRSRLPRRVVVTGPEQDAMVDLLVAARLVTSDDDALEIAHEALTRAWPRLREWLYDDLDGQRILHHLAAAADSWDGLGRPDSELYRGTRLVKALEWQATGRAALTATEQDFLAEGKRLSEAELRAAEDQARHQLRVNRRLRAALSTAAVLLVGALIAGFVAVDQADRADRQAGTAQQLAIAADAQRVGAQAQLSEDISLSLLLATAGLRLHDSPATRVNLLSVLGKHPQLVRSAPAAGGYLEGIELSPDGRLLASGDDANRMHLYDTTDNSLIGTYAGFAESGTQAFVDPVFSPDGRLLVAAAETPDPDPLRLLDPATMQESGPRLARPSLPGRSQRYGIATARFSPDGQFLVATAVEDHAVDAPLVDMTGFALVWDLRARHRPPLRYPLGKGFHSLALSPDGRTMYTTWPMTAYEVATGRTIWRRPDVWTAFSLDASPDGTRLVGEYHYHDRDSTMHVLDARTGDDVTRLRGHTQQPRGLRFSHDGTMVASASHDGEVIVWDTTTWKVKQRWRTFEQTWSINFSVDDRLVFTGGDDGMLRTWDLDAQHTYLRRTAAADSVPVLTHADLSPDGQRVAYRWIAGDQGWIRFADTSGADATPPQRLPTWEGEWVPGIWRSDGKRYVSHAGCSGECGEGGAITVLDPATGKVLAERRVTAAEIESLAYVDGSRSLLAGDADQQLRLLDAETLQVRQTLRTGAADCCTAASADGRTALLLDNAPDAASEQWRVVDTASGEVRSDGVIEFQVYGAAASPAGDRVALTGQSGDVVTIELASGRMQQASTGLGTEVLRVRYSDDGTRLVTGAIDGSVSLWDAATLELLGTARPPQGQGEPLPAMAEFASGTHTVVIATYNGQIFHWDTSPARALETACQMAGRNLTSQEWSQYLPQQPFQKVCSNLP
ncbi:BTAD domain-containing putative transcriptional regulator [Kribbella sp. NPDC050820]|uniref:nSTAND1 domain-containing NTPase n=1 Tax=Kribbella sp. NPDC050820 TaxID=3155408 RepID=UPI0033FB02FA